MSISDVKEGISNAVDIIRFIHSFVDDYVKAIPEAVEFASKCDEYLKIEKIYQQGSLPKELINSKAYIDDAKSECEKIIKEYARDKNFLGKTKFIFILSARAGSYRKYFKDKSVELSKELDKIRKDIKSIAPEPRVKLPAIAKVFWANNFKQTSSVSWDDFKVKYTSENSIDEGNICKFEKYLCVDNHVTIYAFYSTCSQFGYPIMLPVENHVDTMKLAELIMNLNKEFYDPDAMGKHWAKITDLNRNYKEEKKLLKHLITMKENKEKWLQLNISRGIISSLFQRYMMLWRIGKVSQEMFDNVDFPGKARIKIFIYVCETIDKVNYGHLNLDHEKESEKGRPQVYDFLRAVLNNK